MKLLDSSLFPNFAQTSLISTRSIKSIYRSGRFAPSHAGFLSRDSLAESCNLSSLTCWFFIGVCFGVCASAFIADKQVTPIDFRILDCIIKQFGFRKFNYCRNQVLLEPPNSLAKLLIIVFLHFDSGGNRQNQLVLFLKKDELIVRNQLCLGEIQGNSWKFRETSFNSNNSNEKMNKLPLIYLLLCVSTSVTGEVWLTYICPNATFIFDGVLVNAVHKFKSNFTFYPIGHYLIDKKCDWRNFNSSLDHIKLYKIKDE